GRREGRGDLAAERGAAAGPAGRRVPAAGAGRRALRSSDGRAAVRRGAPGGRVRAGAAAPTPRLTGARSVPAGVLLGGRGGESEPAPCVRGHQLQVLGVALDVAADRSEEHTSEL